MSKRINYAVKAVLDSNNRLNSFGHFYTRILRTSLWKDHYDEFPSFTPYIFTDDRIEKAKLLRELKRDLRDFLIEYPV